MKKGYYVSTNGVLFHGVMEDGTIGYYFNQEYLFKGVLFLIEDG